MMKNTETQLFHFELGIPKIAQTKIGTIQLRYSMHAERAARSDRYGNISLPQDLDTNSAQVIEVEMRGRFTLKVVYRVKYNESADLVLVVLPENGMVKTVWLNLNSDLHRTLDASKYVNLKNT